MLDQEFPLCNDCLHTVRLVLPTDIALTASKTMTVYAHGAYEGPLASLVRAKQQRTIAAARQLGMLLAEHMRTWNIPCDYIVPVPLHWRRYAWRGYNQAAIIAAEIARIKGVPVVALVKRTRHTRYQLHCSAHERQQNVDDAFTVAISGTKKFAGKHIVVVDDLLTTGATLTAVGRTILQVQPASVRALVACKVV